MTTIAENHAPAGANAVLDHWRALLEQVHGQMREQAAHPARCVVLLPYAQLMPLATRLWAVQFPDGFAPRFETTRNWAARVGLFTPGPNDLSLDHGRDLLTAAGLLEAAGLGAQRQAWAGLLVEQATQLAQTAASLPPALRADWAERARATLPALDDRCMGAEAALGRIALAWAATSDYASDVLFSPRLAATLDVLFIVPGLQPDPLIAHLAEHLVEKTVLLPAPPLGALGAVALHACADGEDEAERAAACVLAQLAQGRAPVALAAGDRVLTRRISALLAARGLRLRDETGWKLSTTHAAAQIVALLRAAARHASTDEVLDWLKLAPAIDAGAVRTLEARLRRLATRGWAAAAARLDDHPLLAPIDALRAALQAPRPLADWLAALHQALDDFGHGPALQADPAGVAALQALGLAAAAPTGEGGADWLHWPAARRRMSLGAFTRWASDVLEAASYRPPHPAHAQVIVLPMSQLWGRPLAALVLPGADEQRLPAAPEPAGPWTEAQRRDLHLPQRAELQAAQLAAWRVALGVPHVDVLWRSSDDSGESLLPSSLVQALQLAGQGVPGADPRVPRPLRAQPVHPPAPSGAALPMQPLSASAYEMLRACPYRFFALRQLGLGEDGELDVDVGKRDFGNWVHRVLEHFHQALQARPDADRTALMDLAAQHATQAEGLQGGEFLPFAVAWPPLRDGYLAWLDKHQADTGAVFEQAEQRVRQLLGQVQLHGTFDRVDRLPSGAPLVIDYKTESQQRTEARLKAGSEDTQLPFYALLTGHDAPQAAYLNVGEREPAKLFEPKDLLQRASALAQGIDSDLTRIAAGHPLRPLGEGSGCDWCAARGLCRKDFWSD
jgi:ATP-dependent helicase/nuclease subunit B